MPNQRALISVSDKTGLVPFAQKLHDAGVELIASGGTAAQLGDAGLPVTPTEALTGFPELLDGRVKTLHPAIHSGILARRTQEHLGELAQHGLLPIDLVVVNLYPFQQTVADPGVSLAAAVEQIDIGGVALLRAAAKNFESVTVVCEPADYDRVEQAISDSGLDADTRQALALKAFRHTAAYDAAITNFLARQQPQEEPRSQDHDKLPAQIRLDLERVQVMRYGENPHQQGRLVPLQQLLPRLRATPWPRDELQQLAGSGRQLAGCSEFRRAHRRHNQAQQSLRPRLRRHIGVCL